MSLQNYVISQKLSALENTDHYIPFQANISHS